MGSRLTAWDLTPRRWCRRTHDLVVPVPLRAFALQMQKWSSPGFASKRRAWDTPSSLKHVHCAVMAACNLATNHVLSSSKCCDLFIQTVFVNQPVQFGDTNTGPLHVAACTAAWHQIACVSRHPVEDQVILLTIPRTAPVIVPQSKERHPAVWSPALSFRIHAHICKNMLWLRVQSFSKR